MIYIYHLIDIISVTFSLSRADTSPCSPMGVFGADLWCTEWCWLTSKSYMKKNKQTRRWNSDQNVHSNVHLYSRVVLQVIMATTREMISIYNCIIKWVTVYVPWIVQGRKKPMADCLGQVNLAPRQANLDKFDGRVGNLN